MSAEMVINVVISVVTGLGTLFFGYYLLGGPQIPPEGARGSPEGGAAEQPPKPTRSLAWLWGIVLLLWLAVGASTSVLFNYNATSVRQAVTDTESALASKIDSAQQSAVSALERSNQQILDLAQARTDAELAALQKTSTTLLKANRTLIVEKSQDLAARIEDLKNVLLKIQDYTNTSMVTTKNILDSVTGVSQRIDQLSLDTSKVLDLTGKVFSLETDNSAAIKELTRSVDSMIAPQKAFNNKFQQAFVKENFNKGDVATTSAFVQALYLNSLYDVVKTPASLAAAKKAYQAALTTNERFHLDFPWDVQKRKEIITSFANSL